MESLSVKVSGYDGGKDVHLIFLGSFPGCSLSGAQRRLYILPHVTRSNSEEHKLQSDD